MQDTIHHSSYPLADSAHLLPATGADTSALSPSVFRFVDSAATAPAQHDSVAKAISYVNFFEGHQLPVTHQSPIPYKDATPDWLFFVLLIVIAALAWIRFFYGKIFRQTLQALVNMNITNQIVRDENILIQRTSTFLGVIFNIVLALLLYHLSYRLHWTVFNITNTFGRFLFLLLVVSAAYSFKFLLLKITGFVFSAEREMATYIFNIFLINNVLGLVLIPLAVLLSFSITHDTNVVLIAAGVLYGIAFIYRILRGIIIGLSYNGVNLMYLFLYFCALEFAPLLVLVKFLIR